MLYGGVAWSELPNATSWQEITNGEVSDHGLVIDDLLAIGVDIDGIQEFSLTIDVMQSFPVDVQQILR